jgi:HD-GYP domain-containing protein (c-di-GMP phosphodiesterase class II)
LGSRIVAVADAYDAITEERCYNEPMSPDVALNELMLRSGTYFDPDILQAFSAYFEREIEPRHRLLHDRTTLKEPLHQVNGAE